MSQLHRIHPNDSTEPEQEKPERRSGRNLTRKRKFDSSSENEFQMSESEDEYKATIFHKCKYCPESVYKSRRGHKSIPAMKRHKRHCQEKSLSFSKFKIPI